MVGMARMWGWHHWGWRYWMSWIQAWASGGFLRWGDLQWISPKNGVFSASEIRSFKMKFLTFGKICRNHQPLITRFSLLVDVFVLGYGCSNERSGVCWPAGKPSTSVVLSGDMWPASTVSACEFATSVARKTFWIILALVPQSQKTLYPPPNFQGFPVF